MEKERNIKDGVQHPSTNLEISNLNRELLVAKQAMVIFPEQVVELKNCKAKEVRKLQQLREEHEKLLDRTGWMVRS